MKYIAADSETHRIGPGNIAPPIVCMSFARADEETLNHVDLRTDPPTIDATVLLDRQIVPWMWGNGDPELEPEIEGLLDDVDVTTIWANGRYDWACICRTWPRLIPKVFAALAAGRLIDIQHREKLICLSTHGKLDDIKLPSGEKLLVQFNLMFLSGKYLGKDRSAEKEDEDAWRLNYNVLDGWSAKDYPEGARQYALDDASDTLAIYYAQQAIVDAGDGSAVTQELNACADFALYLQTCHGMATDQDEIALIRAAVEKQLAPEKLALLVENKLLRPGHGPRPHAGGHIDPTTGQVKMTAAKKPSLNKKVTQAWVLELCKRLSVAVQITDGGKKVYRKKAIMPDDLPDDFDTSYVGCDRDQQKILAPHCPVMRQYLHRETLGKITSTFLPSVEGHAIVHPGYDVLKETGRTSSFGNPKEKKKRLYPMFQVQNQPRMIKVGQKPTAGKDTRQVIETRKGFVPREGLAFASADYGSVELVSVGQFTWQLFGDPDLCQHYTLVNKGVNLHSYLASGMLMRYGTTEMDREFQLQGQGLDRMGLYELFQAHRSDDDSPLSSTCDDWRDAGKPVGLGFPGMLGPDTMVEFSRKNYDVHMTREEAAEFREFWRETYPEMVELKNWFGEQLDPLNECIGHTDEGRPLPGYVYTSPMGMIRRGASYCAVANGRSMQTPAAEGAKIALFNVARACYDHTQGSILFGCRPCAFIHDEIIMETTRDRSLWHAQAMELSRIMEESMRFIMPDMKITTEATLSSVWSKKAKPTFDDAGLLVPWAPKVAA